jgi:vancomycin resistance protein YoaR
LALFVLASGPFVVSAKVSNNFSAPYGLVVHSDNQNIPVSRTKALETLLRYFEHGDSTKINKASFVFKDVHPNTRTYTALQTACGLEFLDCDQRHFNPYDEVSQKDFLDWFFKLKYLGHSKVLEVRYPKINKESTRYWMEARRLNLITGDAFTYKVMQDFLYRHSVSEANLNIPYNPVLVLNQKEINRSNYHSLKEIETIQAGLKSIVTDFGDSKKMNSKESKFVEKLQGELKAFTILRLSLLENPYILTERSDLNPQVTQLVKHFGLQEVLESYTYDYSKNPAYRKYNLVTGIKKIQDKLLMPGEILDYWNLISNKNLSEFKYGWVIANGQEEWQFGGGICGSATMAFIPMWKAGLEVVERRNHSLFYSNLYPKDQIGLDATVYRPKPNLKLRNNFESPVVFNVINDTKKQVITVEIIGNKTYKSTVVEGPIFVGKRAVKWVRQFEGFDGTIATETLESNYNAIY